MKAASWTAHGGQILAHDVPVSLLVSRRVRGRVRCAVAALSSLNNAGVSKPNSA